MRKNIRVIICIITVSFALSCFWISKSDDVDKRKSIGSAILLDLAKNQNPSFQQNYAPIILNGSLIFPNEIVKDSIELTSASEFLYMGASNEIVEYNTKLGSRRTLAGNQLVPQDDPTHYAPNVEWPKKLVKNGDYIYYFDQGKLQKVYTGNDNKSALELILTQKSLSNNYSTTCNDDNLFWAAVSGGLSEIFKKELKNNSLPAKILAVNGKSRLYAFNNYLYIASGVDSSLSSPRLQKHNVQSKSFSIIQDNIKLNQFSDIPVFPGPGFVYWVNGDSIYKSDHLTGASERVISGLSNIIQLAGNDSVLYALQRMPLGSSYNIIEIDLIHKTSQVVYSDHDIRSILFYNNSLYWNSVSTIYQLSPAGSATELFTNGSIGFGIIECAVQNRIFLTNNWGEPLVCYNIQTNTYFTLSPNAFGIAIANSNELYIVGLSNGIRRLSLDKEIRQPVTIFKGVPFADCLAIKDNWAYWTEYDNSNGFYRISRIKTDGSDYKVLLDSNGSDRIRGLVWYNNGLYFAYSPGQTTPWILASISLDGDAFNPEYGLGLEPVSLTEKDGVFYLADTIDGSSNSIYSINLSENNHSELVSGLPYTNTSFEDKYTIYVSDNYLYYRTYDFRISRNRKINWDIVGQFEILEDSSRWTYNSFYVSGDYLYYASSDGLRRILE